MNFTYRKIKIQLLLFFNAGTHFILKELKQEKDEDASFSATLLLPCSSKESIIEWKQQYEEKSRETFSLHSQPSSKHISYVCFFFYYENKVP